VALYDAGNLPQQLVDLGGFLPQHVQVLAGDPDRARVAGSREHLALAATEITVSSLPNLEGRPTNALPGDAEARIERLNGVVSARTLSRVHVNALVTGTPISGPTRRTAFKVPEEAASPGLYVAVRAQLREGRLPDQGHSDRADRVAMLGPNAARLLGVRGADGPPAVSIGDDVFVVIGILQSVRSGCAAPWGPVVTTSPDNSCWKVPLWASWVACWARAWECWSSPGWRRISRGHRQSIRRSRCSHLSSAR
jgi:hypothetical protein